MRCTSAEHELENLWRSPLARRYVARAQVPSGYHSALITPLGRALDYISDDGSMQKSRVCCSPSLSPSIDFARVHSSSSALARLLKLQLSCTRKATGNTKGRAISRSIL